MRYIKVLSIIWIGILYEVMCLSVFEVSILRLNNNRGVNQYGRCCSGARTTPPCTSHCRTYFTACLMHSIQAMPENPLCTYGFTRTITFDHNNLIFLDQNANNTMKIPISFKWPVRFTLVVEAWHDIPSNLSVKDSGLLIVRSIISKHLQPSFAWRGESYNTPTTELQYKYRLICLPNFYGNGCDVMCRARDDQFGHYSCSDNGTRICKLGWSGTFCEEALCSDECLQNNGFCEIPFECRCPIGWQGTDCGQCERSSGCLNGICFQPYQCICKGGWGGYHCDIDLNYCSKSQPCLNGGTCKSNLQGNYTCKCGDNYGGENCQIEKCYDGYCLNNGHCMTQKWARFCTCTAEYYGDVCQYAKKDCKDIICHNGGTCETGSTGGACACPSNTTGKFCETRLDACTSNPCDNGAECIATQSGYTCICLPNYAGSRCSYKINPCYDFSCYNGGRCVVRKGYTNPFCECPRNFTGDKCQIPLDPCHKVNCLNGGSCNQSPMGNGFICKCKDNFFGEFCEEIMNLCKSSPCKNRAKCKNYVTSFLCLCPPQFYGERCELEVMLADNMRNISIETINDSVDENPEVASSSINLDCNWITIPILKFVVNLLIFQFI